MTLPDLIEIATLLERLGPGIDIPGEEEKISIEAFLACMTGVNLGWISQGKAKNNLGLTSLQNQDMKEWSDKLLNNEFSWEEIRDCLVLYEQGIINKSKTKTILSLTKG